MPELPEVETVCRGLDRVLTGEVLADVTVRRRDLRWPIPEGVEDRLRGRRVTAVHRRAKFGLIDTDAGDTLIFHLGMSGRMRLDPDTVELHDHVIFRTASGRQVHFNDARRFGSLDLVPTDAWAAHRHFVALGPEPLGNDFHAEHLAEAFRGRMSPVKAALLDQHVVAGLGNIYVAEALFRAGIHPKRSAARIAEVRLQPLVDAIRHVLMRAIETGGSTIRDYVQVDGELGYFQHEWTVYGRDGEACRRCAAPIRRIVQSGRSTFYCAACQR